MDKKETDGFTNVDSFSQLLFIRPPKEKAIKLFGIEFEVDNPSDEELVKDCDNNKGESSNSSSNKRFECHYCCKNFPTSQALGGHQNAHKTERQQAKRMLSSSSSSLSDHYGFYRNHYSTWNSSTRFFGGHASSFTQQPINYGTPLTLWRSIPTPLHSGSVVNRDRSLLQPLPLFAGDKDKPSSLQVSGSSQGRFGFEPKPSLHDHVSLDLHL